ncbi:MAG: DUF4381 domain-containing protein, partial [Arenibacterium sp.]
EGLGLVDLIGLLEEAPEPSPISLMPQTSGWIVLGIVLVVSGIFVVRWVQRRIRAGAYRRAALRELASAKNDPALVASILRRTALTAFPREQIATLAGAEWLAFLDRSFPGNGFSDGPGRIFAIAPFRPQVPDPDAMVLARDWIKRHRSSQRAA